MKLTQIFEEVIATDNLVENRRDKKDIEQDLINLIDTEYESINNYSVKQLFDWAISSIPDLTFDIAKKVYKSIYESDVFGNVDKDWDNNTVSDIKEGDETISMENISDDDKKKAISQIWEIYEDNFDFLSDRTLDELLEIFNNDDMLDIKIDIEFLTPIYNDLVKYKENRKKDPDFRSPNYTN